MPFLLLPPMVLVQGGVWVFFVAATGSLPPVQGRIMQMLCILPHASTVVGILGIGNMATN